MRRVAFCLLLVACGDGDDGDGDAPVAYELRVWADAAELGALEVFIDGEATTTLSRQYADQDELAAARTRIELRDGALVVDTLELSPAFEAASCTQGVGEPTRVYQAVCSAGNGELRRASIMVDHVAPDGDTGTCVGDSFCVADCTLAGCGAGQKCASAFVDGDLRYSKLACVAAGAGGTGAACTWSADASGRWGDDCDHRNVCVDGTCRERCAGPGTCAGDATCTRPPGHAREVTVCL